MTPKLVILQSWKKLQVIDFFFQKQTKKKCFQLVYAGETFKTVSGNFFKINGSRDIQPLVILWFRKIVLRNKTINKTQSTKNQKNYAYCFGENCPIDHLVKFTQDRIKP